MSRVAATAPVHAERADLTLDALSGDPAAVDALLERVPNMRSAIRPLLLLSEVTGVQLRRVTRAYLRWKRRGTTRALSNHELDVVGALGFWLMTMRMMIYSTRPAATQAGRLARQLDKLVELFDEPAKEIFAHLYELPRVIDPKTVRLHRLGTSSFILKGESRQTRRNPKVIVYALKCRLFPYTENRALAEETKRYATTYRDEKNPYLVYPYESHPKWVLMDFVDGQSLDQLISTDKSPATLMHLDLARLRAYGVPLLDALASVPFEHLDLAPAHIMVPKSAGEHGDGSPARIVLINFGPNHGLRLVAGATLDAATVTRYVAPELLNAELAAPTTGLEDVYSLGQILVDLSIHFRTEAGYIPKELYMDAPLLGRFVEDLLDRDPDKRLLLLRTAEARGLNSSERLDVYRELRERLFRGLAAHEVLSTVAPTLAPEPPDIKAGALARVASAIADASDTIYSVLEFEPIKRPLQFRKVAREGDPGTRREFGYFFDWALACTFGWAIVWILTSAYVLNETLHGTLIPALPEVVQPGFPPVSWDAIVRHYATLGSSGLTGLENLPGRLVALTFGLAGTRYYLEIFGMLSVRGILSAKSRQIVEWSMRLSALWFAPLVILGNLFFVRHWLLFSAVALIPVCTNNYLCWRLASQLVKQGRTEFSTVRNSEVGQSISAYSEWWKLMAMYGGMLVVIGLLTEVGLAHDIWVYAVVVIAVNMLKLYRSNCGKLAPALRAALSHAFVTGERLDALDSRRVNRMTATGLVGTPQLATAGH